MKSENDCSSTRKRFEEIWSSLARFSFLAIVPQSSSYSESLRSERNYQRSITLGLPLIRNGQMAVPEDISVVGYDNNDICEGIIPSLTTVDHRLEELGQCLAQGLLTLVEGGAPNIRKTIVPRLVERRSHAAKATLLSASCTP